jgi:membrane protein
VIKGLSRFSDQITAGALGSFGLVTSIGIGFILFLSVESIWNRIFESHRERTYVERFLLFYTGITLLPFVAAVSYLRIASLSGRYALTRLFLSLFTTAVVLSLANRLVPTVRVRWRAALIGGVTAAVLLEVAKFGLGLYLSFVTGSYASIYGTLGVLPLFLLSIYLSWVIILWGVEVCRSLQRLPLLARSLDEPGAPIKADDPNLIINGALAARLLCDVARNFKGGNRSLPVLELEERHGLPESVVRRVLTRLEAHHLVVQHEDGYLLARPPDTIRLDEVLRIFQPPAHFYAQSEPDALDQVLGQLDMQAKEQTSTVTFASLI